MAELWHLLACQEDDAEHIVDVPVPQIYEELVDSAQIIPQERTVEQTVKFAESFGEAQDQHPSIAAEKSVGEAQPPGLAKYDASTELELAKSPGDVRPPVSAKCSATTARIRRVFWGVLCVQSKRLDHHRCHSSRKSC